MAQLLLQPSLMERPSLVQRWNSFREKKKQTSNYHQPSSSSKAKGAADDRTRSVGRAQRRNSFVRVDRAETTTSQNTGGLIITSTSTKTVSHRTSKNEVEAPRKPSSMSSLKLSKKSSPKIKVKKSKSGAIVAASTTSTKKVRRKNYDEEVAPRKPSSMPNLIRSGSSRSLKKKKKSKSTVKTTTTKSCTIHPHMLYEKPKSFSSLQQGSSLGSPRGSKMKKSKSLRSMRALLVPAWPITVEEEFDESPPSPRKSLNRSKSLRALSGSLRNVFDTENTSDTVPRQESPQRPSSFRKISKSSKKKAKDQKQQAPRRQHKIIIVC
mmetsp:Transcript_11133/g.28215  ORF Transcript_11133/g.28215 Transcript_11133/m.28215 type:complete len:323 (+) Transcript_11133:109-1077(+)